jgi:hypothetical protein
MEKEQNELKIERRVARQIEEWKPNFKQVKTHIPSPTDWVGDSPDDTTPYTTVTLGFDDDGYLTGWQTGDNSFSGDAYGSPHWAVVDVTRRKSWADFKAEALDQALDLIIGF